MRGAAQAVLDQGDVELQLPGAFGFELAGLELDDEVPQLLDVEEQQVGIEVLATDVEVDLPSHEGESWAEFPQRIDDPVGQGFLELAFGDLAGQVQEIKDQRVLGDLLGQLGIVRNKLLRKGGQRQLTGTRKVSLPFTTETYIRTEQRKELAMSTRNRKTADQILAGARTGHRMAGMDVSDEAEDLGRRMLAGELTRDEAVRRAIAAARARHAS